MYLEKSIQNIFKFSIEKLTTIFFNLENFLENSENFLENIEIFLENLANFYKFREH